MLCIHNEEADTLPMVLYINEEGSGLIMYGELENDACLPSFLN